MPAHYRLDAVRHPPDEVVGPRGQGLLLVVQRERLKPTRPVLASAIERALVVRQQDAPRRRAPAEQGCLAEASLR